MIIKKFNYNDKDREVVVLYKSETQIAGIDLNYLNEDEKKEVREIFKDSEIKSFSEMASSKLNENEKREKAEWMRAFRRFTVNVDELFKEEQEKADT